MDDEDLTGVPVLRAKMFVSEIVYTKSTDGKTEQEKITLNAVYEGSEENEQWSRFTPSGTLTLYINNPDAFGKVANGHEFYINLVPA